MKVLQVPPYAPPMRGGSEIYAFTLSKQLKEQGHYVEIFCAHWPRWTKKIDNIDGIPVWRFMTTMYMLDVNPLSFFWQYVYKRVGEFDILHAHSYIYFLVNQVAAVRFVKRFPFILHLHGGLGFLPSSAFGPLNTIFKTGYDKTVGPITVRRADKVIACSESDKRLAIKELWADPDKIVVIPNAIEESQFYYREPEKPIVTFIGRLTTMKGADQFPTIIRRVTKCIPNVQFNIIGEGMLEEGLKQTLKNYDVKFFGSIPHERIPKILAKSSMLMLPTRMEGMPLVVLEAMASGKPCVVYDVGGVAEIVQDDITGFCPKVGRVGEFSDRIIQIIENESLRRLLGRNGRKLIDLKHTWKANADAVMKVYKQFV